jgi:hypothetical protein
MGESFRLLGRAGVFPTVEVRWFYKGKVPPNVLAWFQQWDPRPDQQPHRVDHYLHLPDTVSLGVKWREGRLEVKQRRQQSRVVQFHEWAAGLVEHWRKWSFELANQVAPPPSWTAVAKKRQLRRYRLAGGEKISSVPADEFPDQGCDVELTQVQAREETWWTVGFEAFGEESTLHETLLLVTRQILAADESPTVKAQESFGYPKWLQIIRR